MSSTPTPVRNGRRSSKTVVIKLPASRLSLFPHEKTIAKSASKSSSNPSTPSAAGKDSPQPTDPSQPIKSETPNENASTPQPTTESKRKGPGGPRGGVKRGANALGDGTPRARAKPGPKRRKLNGIVNGDDGGKPWTQSAPTGGHKLGPKANQGAINAGLRALDRSGPPCRKWTKRGFTVKSFTGIVWELPTWSAPKHEAKDEDNDEPKTDAYGQPMPSSSNVGSDTSRQHANDGNDANEGQDGNEGNDASEANEASEANRTTELSGTNNANGATDSASVAA